MPELAIFRSVSLRVTIASFMGGAALIASLAGCVAVDGRSWKEPVAAGGAAGISGRFAVRAAYVSDRMGFHAWDRLDLVLNVSHAKEADTVVLSLRDEEGLSVQFERNGAPLHAVVYRFSDGLKVTPEGKLELPGASGCNSRDSPGLGCASNTITLFRNPSGELVAVQSGGGAGLVGIFPFGIYARLVSVFPEVRNDACDFVRRGSYMCRR